jgi:hypothetical protein
LNPEPTTLLQGTLDLLIASETALAVFGVTGHFAINIIYKAAIVCFSSALWVWRDPCCDG